MTWHSPGLEDMPQSSDHSEAVVAEGRQTCREARLGYAQGQVDKRRDVAPCHVKGCFSVLCGALPGSTPLPIDGGNRGSFIVPDPFLPTDVIHRQSTTFPSNPKSAYRVIRSTRPNLSSSLAKHTLEPHRATDAPIKTPRKRYRSRRAATTLPHHPPFTCPPATGDAWPASRIRRRAAFAAYGGRRWSTSTPIKPCSSLVISFTTTEARYSKMLHYS